LRWFDSHCHIDDDFYQDHRHEIIQECQSQGLQRMLVAGTAPQYFVKQVALCEQFNLDFALGIHPWFIDSDAPEMLEQLEQAIEKFKPQAIGECGLDKIKGASFDMQKDVFRAQLKLSQKYNLPVVIHSVKAHKWVIEQLQSISLNRKGVIHGFYGSKEQAHTFVNLGFKLGIGPFLCRATAHKLHDVVKHIPLENLILESDSPFGQMNRKGIMQPTSPLSIIEVAKKIAELRDITVKQVAEVTFESTLDLFS
tara:strand:- start:800 stop:1558 length:759 start_codon:yes stop_codon:yes gene_type:complete